MNGKRNIKLVNDFQIVSNPINSIDVDKFDYIDRIIKQ